MDTATTHPARPSLKSPPGPSAGPDARAVLITGAGTGIGRATARAFAAAGDQVLAVGRRPGPLARTADGHPGIRPWPADITAPGAPEAVVAAALDAFGRLDVLVNNAGIVSDQRLGTLTAEGQAPQWATNVLAPALLTQAALPALERHGRGVVVNVTTSVGQRAWPGNSMYAATKAALEALTRGWAVDLAARGVRVAAVAPGAVRTPIGDHAGVSPERQAAVREWQLAHTPLGRLGTPEEVAWAVRQLASPGASFLTGVVLAVDGGAVVA